jgi:hypothetical protein
VSQPAYLVFTFAKKEKKTKNIFFPSFRTCYGNKRYKKSNMSVEKQGDKRASLSSDGARKRHKTNAPATSGTGNGAKAFFLVVQTPHPMGCRSEHHTPHTTLLETTPQGAPLCDTTP